MNEIIRIAIEKGGLDRGDVPNEYTVVLNPKFWQALGKALGWPEINKLGNESCWGWRSRALEYFDLLMTGGNTDNFWSDLIKSDTSQEREKEC